MNEDQDEISKTINRIHELVTPFMCPSVSPTYHQVNQYYLRGKNVKNTFGASINVWGFWYSQIKAKGASQLETLLKLQKKLEIECQLRLKQLREKKTKLDSEVALVESLISKD